MPTLSGMTGGNATDSGRMAFGDNRMEFTISNPTQFPALSLWVLWRTKPVETESPVDNTTGRAIVVQHGL